MFISVLLSLLAYHCFRGPSFRVNSEISGLSMIHLVSMARQETLILLPPTKEEVHVFARVRLSVCLSVSKITQKRVHGFG